MVLCDTHIAIWYLLDSPELGQSLRARMAANPQQFALSAVSSWEFALLIEKGRLEASPLLNPRTLVDETEFVQLPLTADIAVLSRTLPFPHGDPADRFLAATAFHHEIALVTRDERLHGIPWLRTTPE